MKFKIGDIVMIHESYVPLYGGDIGKITKLIPRTIRDGGDRFEITFFSVRWGSWYVWHFEERALIPIRYLTLKNMCKYI